MSVPTKTPEPGADKARLLADLGGTHVRFGIKRSGRLENARELVCSEHPHLVAAATVYLQEARPVSWPRAGVFAVASPGGGDFIRLTNSSWSFSRGEVIKQLGLEELVVVNDFWALAHSLPVLEKGDLRVIRRGEPQPGSPMAVLGPGTGLGASALIPHGGVSVAVAGEGGHRDLAVASAREWQVVERLQQRFGHVSAERVLSGSGLAALYSCLCSLAGAEAEEVDAAAVVRRSLAGGDGPAVEAVELFAAWLGAVAGDLALILGARGGVYLGGGMLVRMGDAFREDLFCRRFLAKGRFADYLEAIPVQLIQHPWATLLGLCQLGPLCAANS